MWNITKTKIWPPVLVFLLWIGGLAQARLSSYPFGSILFGSSILITPPKVEWEMTFGSEYDDIGHSVQQTCDGGYIVTGMIGSDDGGPGDIYLFKTDASGNLVWEKRFGRVGIPGDDDAGRSVQQTTDGGYIVAGWTGVGIDNEDAYFLKTDASGNIEWDNRFGGAACEQFFSVQQTKDGGYIATGWTGSFGHGLEDVYLVKTDGSGNMTWERAFGGTGRDYGYSIQQTHDGGYVVAGVSYLLARHISDAYLVKTDSSGNLLWERKYGGSDTFEYAYSMDQTSDGGYILAGCAPGGNGYLVKTDTHGNALWEKTFVCGAYGNFFSVQQTRDGGYIAAGYGEGSGASLIKTDASGNLVWEKVLGNSGTIAYCVQQTRDGGYILTGGTWGGGSDVYLAKLGPDVSEVPRTFYVDDDAPNDPGPGDPGISDPREDGTQPHPFDSIQAAIDAASNGDTIVVEEGTYFENINFRGKNIVLTSTDPNDPNVVAATIIDGNNLDSVVTFAGTEDATCVLSGFTVRNGYADYGAGIYGGTWEKQTRAEIRNNIIAANTVWYGGALDYCHGTIQNNVVSGTTILCDGGAIFDCQGIIQNNTILDNPIGLIRCNGIIQNNTLSGNGAAVGECDGIIQNNIISGNQGGLMYCNGIIQNNTISDNPTGIYRGDEAIIRNNIISGNQSDLGLIYCHGLIQYNLISGWTGGGEGNIDADPCFTDPNNGDYHLKSEAGRWDVNEGRWTIDEVTSPCIDAGDPMTAIGREPFPNGGRINMGAYGGTAEASKSYFGKPPCEIIVAGDINGDCAVNFIDFRLMALHWLTNGNF